MLELVPTTKMINGNIWGKLLDTDLPLLFVYLFLDDITCCIWVWYNGFWKSIFRIFQEKEDLMMKLGTPWRWYISIEKQYIENENLVGNAIKWTYFVRRPHIIHMTMWMNEFSRWVMKSIVISSQAWFNIDLVIVTPFFYGWYFFCWHVEHSLTKFFTSLYRPDHTRDVASLAMFELTQEWHKVGVKWYSRRISLRRSLKSVTNNLPLK